MSTEHSGSQLAFHKYNTALTIIRQLRQKGHTALLAGGCVRDILLRRRAQDYDIVTSALPQEVKESFEHTIPVGEKFGVVKVLMAGVEFEVATFRADAEYRDGRHPESVRFATIQEDAARRDFTVNGMFYDPVDGKVLDYVGGQVDIQQRAIRAIGDPELRFSEDYLRMMRAVRFAVVLDFKIVGDTFKAVQANAPRITQISPERIRGELETMLLHPKRAAAVELLEDALLLPQILPEVSACRGVKQGKLLHPEGDVWQHTLLALSLLQDPSFEFALAVLLHDIGKPATVDRTSERLFPDHERVGEQMAREIASRLRLSKRETETVAFLVRHHMALKDAPRMRKSTLKRILSHEFFDYLAEIHRIDALSSNGDLTNYNFAMDARKALSAEALKPKPLVNGDDLSAIGIPPSPVMGDILKKLYTAQLDEQISTRDEALEMARKLASGELKE